MTQKTDMKSSNQQYFSPLSPNHKLSVQFTDPDSSSDGGALLLRETEIQTSIIKNASESLTDARHQSYIEHSYSEMMMQRVIQIAMGYFDGNDCDWLKHDPMMKIICKDDNSSLCSQPTMCRFENSLTAKDLIRLAYAIGDNFLNGFNQPPEIIVIDMDPTVNKVYGDQQLSLFNGFVDDYCFMPFHVYDGISGQLITSILRPGKTPSGPEIKTILCRIVKHIRKRFPQTKLIFRADSHHARTEVLDYLDEQDVDYVIGLSSTMLPRNCCKHLRDYVEKKSREDYYRVRRFHSFSHQVGSWNKSRRIICRAEGTAMGSDLRYIVTNLNSSAKYLYDEIYCDRGNAELMIKESKLSLGADRTSCHDAKANQFRLFLHGLAYQVMHSFRSNILKGTKWQRSTFLTIRLKILKVAARVERGKTFTRIHMPVSTMSKDVYQRFSSIVSYMNTT